MPMRRMQLTLSSLMLSSLIMSGCAGLDLAAFRPGDSGPPLAPPAAPEGPRLAALANEAAAKAKLSGAVEISPVRAAHDSQWGDWVFCIKGADPLPPYAVLVGHDAVLEVRASILIDGCANETYVPLAQPGKTPHK